MATLQQEIENVFANGKSKAGIKKALKVIGLTDLDIAGLILLHASELPTTTRKAQHTFGVEIECFVNRSALCASARSNGVSCQGESYNHQDNTTHFKIVSDASVYGYADPNEVVSPILKGSKGQNALKAICKSLSECSARVNRSCGLHVHIGLQNVTEQQYVNIFKNYAKLERIIDSFMAESRRGSNNFYCKSICNANFGECATKTDIDRELRSDRYYKVNPIAYRRHNTIEFRQHQGTTDYNKISNWIAFLTALVDFSKNNALTAEPQSIEDLTFLPKKVREYYMNRISELN